MLARSAKATKALALRWNSNIRMGELEEQWHFSSLEKIFIEKRIYRRIEECTTWRAFSKKSGSASSPTSASSSARLPTTTSSASPRSRSSASPSTTPSRPTKRSAPSRKTSPRSKSHLRSLTKYTIAWFESLKEKYGKGRGRRTELSHLRQGRCQAGRRRQRHPPTSTARKASPAGT